MAGFGALKSLLVAPNANAGCFADDADDDPSSPSFPVAVADDVVAAEEPKANPGVPPLAPSVAAATEASATPSLFGVLDSNANVFPDENDAPPESSPSAPPPNEKLGMDGLLPEVVAAPPMSTLGFFVGAGVALPGANLDGIGVLGG